MKTNQSEDLEKELKKLRNYLNYKNASFCQKKLDVIINYCFGDN